MCTRETMTLTAAITFTLYLGLGQTLPKYDLLCPIRTVYHPPYLIIQAETKAQRV